MQKRVADQAADQKKDAPIPGKESSAGAQEVQELNRQLRLANEELRESEERFRFTFERAAVGMAHTGLDGKFVRVNPRFCEILGYTAEEMQGLAFSAITHAEDIEADSQIMQELRSGQREIYVREKRYRRKDGSHVWCKIVVSVIRDGSDAPQCFITVVEDISSRKLEEARQQEHINKFRTLADSMPQMVWTAQPDGSIDYYNQRWLDYTGLTFEETQGWGWKQTQHPDDVQGSVDRWQKSLATGKVLEHEMRFLRASDKSWRWHFTRGVPVRDENGKIVQWVGTCTDIDDKKASEHALHHVRGELETRVLERTAELRHEISERKKAEDELRELSNRLVSLRDMEQRRIARELHDSAGQLLTATTLNLAAVVSEAERLTPQGAKALAEVSDLVQETIKEVRVVSYLLHPPLLDETGLRSALGWYLEGFSARGDVKVDLIIDKDFGRLPTEIETAIFRIVQECLTNIHRHSGSKTAKVEVVRSPTEILVEVQDQGRGMPAQRPSGVGLRGMRERLAQFGGALEIRSSEKGTTIMARVPFAESEASAE